VRAWSLALITLTPMSVFVAASLSGDGATNALALLVVALVVRMLRAPLRSTGRAEAWCLVCLCALLGLVKPGYQVLAALPLLVPANRFRSATQRWTLVVGALATTLATSLLWQLSIEAAQPLALGPEADPRAQLAHILAAPVGYAWTLVASAARQAIPYVTGFVGVLGHLDVVLPLPVYAVYPLLLLVLMLADAPDPEALTALRRLSLVVLFGLGMASVLTLAYLGWNPVGASYVIDVQGRYFLPLAPLLALALPAKRSLPGALVGWAPTVVAASGLGVGIVAVVLRYWS